MKAKRVRRGARKPGPSSRRRHAAVQAINLFDFAAGARARMSEMAYAYLSGGGADEITLRRNRDQLDALCLVPRVLVDVGAVDTRLELFGEAFAFPILLAPTGFQRLAHPEGEIATARGAAAADATYVTSTVATTSIEAIGAATTGRLWFQLYIQRDRGFTRELVQRAEAAGCQALCITVDTPVLGPRDREKRAGMALPPGLTYENLKGLMAPDDQHAEFHRGIYNPFLDPTITWETIAWVRSFARVPVLLKGVLAPDDARRAADEGVTGVIVSNHGGRNLDTVPASIEALPRVVEAVAGRIPVLMDGGVRRGTDVIKALALGAKAVLIGRPYVWGLACAGAEGVQRVVEILRSELEMAMALCGVPKLARIDRTLLWDPRE